MNERPVAGRETVRESTEDIDRTRASDIRDDRAQRQDEAQDTGFLPDDRMDSLRERWDEVQAGFVDDPRSAVQNAHGLVTDLVDELTDTFTRERGTLESQWSGGREPDTETLRVALQRYRDFFNRLLAT
jgi:hypothetical protein